MSEHYIDGGGNIPVRSWKPLRHPRSRARTLRNINQLRGNKMAKEKKATKILNVNLAGIESAFTVAMSLIGEEHPAHKVLKGATERFDAMREALITVQFHAAQI